MPSGVDPPSDKSKKIWHLVVTPDLLTSGSNENSCTLVLPILSEDCDWCQY